MFVFKSIRTFSSKLFSNVNDPQKGIALLLCAIVGGHLCDNHYQFSFPFFKVVFSCIAIIVFFMIQEIKDEEEKEG